MISLPRSGWFFYILRIQQESAPTSEMPGQIAVKFYPIRNFAGIPLRIFSQSPEEALEMAKARFPLLRYGISTQECTSYDNRIAGIIAAARANIGKQPNRVQGRDATKDLVAQS